MRNLSFSTNIQNLTAPSCKKCVHMIPSKDIIQFSSPYSRCKKFGVKDMVTDEINYYYASDCRKYTNTCGSAGSHFQLEPNLTHKIWKHRFTNHASICIIITGVSISSLFSYIL
jgi:hypothetical protein